MTDEISERQKQLEMINIINESIRDKAVIPENTFIGIEDIMEKKNNGLNKKRLAMVLVGVGIAATLGLAFMVWLIVSQIWWGLAVYIAVAIISLVISALQFKDSVFICPKCNSEFKPYLIKAFFSTGDHKVRWINCQVCNKKEWCVLRKPMKAVVGTYLSMEDNQND